MRRERGAFAALAVAVALAGARAAAAEDPPPTPGPAPAPVAAPGAAAGEVEARLRGVVEHLASPALGGRKEPVDRLRAARFIAERLSQAGLSLVPGQTGMLLDVAAKDDRPAGQNVAAWLPGTGPEHVILSAHYDHLGTRDGALHPGADDNASGVAAMLECARALAKGPKPRRSIGFVAFDLEEGEPWSKGPGGSTAWVERPPVPLEGLAAFVTADMLGRSFGDAFPGTLFVMGSERAAGLRETVDGLSLPAGTTLHRLGMDFNALGWSDYLPFERVKVPCLFFTTGTCRDYHRPGDTADRIDYPRLAAHARLLADATRALADRPERPVWIAEPEPTVEEMRSVLTIVRGAEAAAEGLGVTDAQKTMIRVFRTSLEGLVAKGTVTKGERLFVRFGALRLFKEAERIWSDPPPPAPPAEAPPDGVEQPEAPPAPGR